MPEEKDEIKTLFPEIDIEGVKLRPWTFGQFVEMGPILHQIVMAARNTGMKPEELEDRIPELILITSPFIPEIVAKTTGLSQDEIKSWPPDKGIAVLLGIMTQNTERLKNLFGLSRTLLPKRANG
jgi:hypothetical protein